MRLWMLIEIIQILDVSIVGHLSNIGFTRLHRNVATKGRNTLLNSIQNIIHNNATYNIKQPLALFPVLRIAVGNVAFMATNARS
jgi:hypothetical protein